MTPPNEAGLIGNIEIIRSLGAGRVRPSPDLSKVRVAVVHEWLDTYAGSERVVEQILHCFPQADVFAVVDFLPPDQRGFLNGRQVTTTFIQNLPFARRRFRTYLGLMPLAVEQFDLTPYELVISSSHAVRRGSSPAPIRPMSAITTRRCATPGICSISIFDRPT